jgi:hypothetical protein
MLASTTFAYTRSHQARDHALPAGANTHCSPLRPWPVADQTASLRRRGHEEYHECGDDNHGHEERRNQRRHEERQAQEWKQRRVGRE